jgi:hypothetical protein
MPQETARRGLGYQLPVTPNSSKKGHQRYYRPEVLSMTLQVVILKGIRMYCGDLRTFLRAYSPKRNAVNVSFEVLTRFEFGGYLQEKSNVSRPT